MLENGYLYIEDLNKEIAKLWYEKEYQYYFCGRLHSPMTFDDKDMDHHRRFASVNPKDNSLIGMIAYTIDESINCAWSFSAIRFPKGDKLIFGKDLLQAIDDIFNRFGINRLGFGVAVGNPAENMYDKFINRLGGTICGYQHDSAVDEANHLLDFKQYEVLAKNYHPLKK